MSVAAENDPTIFNCMVASNVATLIFAGLSMEFDDSVLTAVGRAQITLRLVAIILIGSAFASLGFLMRARDWSMMAPYEKLLAAATALPGLGAITYLGLVLVLACLFVALAVVSSLIVLGVAGALIVSETASSKSCTACAFAIPATASVCGYCGRRQGRWPF